LNRLITTFDEVPPNNPYASQRKNHGVTFKTSTVEVFRPIPNTKPKLNIRNPQGLRRPRFSFFIFTCQTACPFAVIDYKAATSIFSETRRPRRDHLQIGNFPISSRSERRITAPCKWQAPVIGSLRMTRIYGKAGG